jgi:rubrerythrin
VTRGTEEAVYTYNMKRYRIRSARRTIGGMADEERWHTMKKAYGRG